MGADGYMGGGCTYHPGQKVYMQDPERPEGDMYAAWSCCQTPHFTVSDMRRGGPRMVLAKGCTQCAHVEYVAEEVPRHKKDRTVAVREDSRGGLRYKIPTINVRAVGSREGTMPMLNVRAAVGSRDGRSGGGGGGRGGGSAGMPKGGGGEGWGWGS